MAAAQEKEACSAQCQHCVGRRLGNRLDGGGAGGEGAADQSGVVGVRHGDPNTAIPGLQCGRTKIGEKIGDVGEITTYSQSIFRGKAEGGGSEGGSRIE